MAWSTRSPEQSRHHAIIQSRLYPSALLLQPSILRALRVWQARRGFTFDQIAERVESTRLSPFRRLWDDATSIPRRCGLFRHIHRWCNSKGVGYLTRTKDCVFRIISEWLTMVENQIDRKLKCLKSDKKGQYKLDEFVKFIKWEYTIPYSP